MGFPKPKVVHKKTVEGDTITVERYVNGKLDLIIKIVKTSHPLYDVAVDFYDEKGYIGRNYETLCCTGVKDFEELKRLSGRNLWEFFVS
ncbi:MAG: hypothetical protein OWQ50_03110, partial [Acidianus infernus]|nr:hypothetical protein [Acidianus infernus]